jgi:hypothetical protein
MKNALRRPLILALGLTLIASMAFAKNNKKQALSFSDYQVDSYSTTRSDYKSEQQALSATASAGTTILLASNFDASPTACAAQGWVAVDLSTVSGTYFHIDNYAGLPAADYAPIRGSQSLWCGTRSDNPDVLVCSYESPPGYGNNWDQTWQTKLCIPVSVDDVLDVAMIAQWNSHYSYCGWAIEYTSDCSGTGVWDRLLGGVGFLTDLGPSIPVDFDSVITLSAPVVTSGANTVKVRLRFQSQHAYSDEDGVYPTNGALHVDSLKVEGLATEDFEGEDGVGPTYDTSSNDWIASNVPGFGNYMGLFPGISNAQDDPCRRDLSCMWAAISGSNEFGTCFGKPAQRIVPLGNAAGAYIHNEVWSPKIALGASTGSVLNMEFSVYRHLPLANLVFYIWRVRQYDTGETCPEAWHDINFVYYSNGADWLRHGSALAPLLDLGTAEFIQVGLGVLDNCRPWCGGAPTTCHTHAPMFDTVRVYRVEVSGPQWTVRDLEQFQDNFAETAGPGAGWVRADAGNSIINVNVAGIDPGDSAIVFTLADPEAGLADDGTGNKKVYIYVATWPQGQTDKDGAALTQDPARFPYVGNQVIGGITWDCVRLDDTPALDKYCIDLNDCLWEPCDTVCFFYCAENTNGIRTYLSGSALTLQTSDIDQAASFASEFTCLPAGGWKNGGDILYVDGMDGRGAQPYFDTAFQALGLLDEVDRYDVRGPSSNVADRPGSRVKDVGQLLDCYRKIIWDQGDLIVGPGNGRPGVGTNEKSPDGLMLSLFLDGLENPGGLYLCGDDAPGTLKGQAGTDQANFRDVYIPFTMSTPNAGNHVAKGYGINPLINCTPGGCFAGDTFYAYGGCLLINDFDVMTPSGASAMEASYGAPTGVTNSAIVSKVTANTQAPPVNVGVIISGFSFIYIRDDENDGVLDRAKHMHDILVWLQNTPPDPTGTGTVASNSLSQNYPNPFNPQTTIAFSVKERGLVNLKVYNVAGQLVRTLANESFAVGAHTKVWDGRNDAGQAVSSGVYFYKLVANNFSQTKKMVLLK